MPHQCCTRNPPTPIAPCCRLTVANVIASGAVSMLPIVSGAVEDALLRWLRAAELTCDRAALLVAQDPRVVISALMKLAGG